MSDVLSQNQIDELLKNLNNADTQTLENMSENLSEKKVRTYDFKSPKKFTKEQLKAITQIYESYARMLSSYFTSITRFYCRVDMVQTEEQRFYEFNNALPDCTMMGNIDFSFANEEIIADTKAMIQFSSDVSYSLIDRLLGGYGRAMDVNRDFTDIEIRVMESVFKKMGNIFADICSQYIKTTAVLDEIEINARVNQPIVADEVIVLATFEIEFNDVKNVFTMSVPAVMMESIASIAATASKKAKRGDSQKELENRNEIIRKISRSNFRIEAVLAKTTVNLDEILSLHEDDVLLLNVPIDRNISLFVNNEKLFDGKMGLVNRRKAIKICNVYDVRR